MRFVILVFAALIPLLSACSTPAPVKDAATVSAAQMARAQSEMTRFTTDWDASNAQMADLTARLKFDAAEQATSHVMELKKLELIESPGFAAYNAILVLADMRAAAAVQEMVLKGQLAAEVRASTGALPTSSGKVDKARAAVLALAVDRPDEAQAKEALDWVKAAWDGSKDTRKKLKDMK